ncbi:hypothetical protein [Tropicimonas sp. IMCC6043]|uniref:hypothetical protein n=1 Tax=Tropicimonas sp. IMCC6043 TaxID=2510645 RepID=UPI00101DB064|nr:hypothetical protein [Tropicimonas sp. IMCC6043]RYH12195.1 hypothetical protein EU800_01125 [Tropicimonas sp. IMCC6043]
MKTIPTILALVLSVSAAHAMSNMQSTVIKDLADSGVPEACLQKVTVNDATRINGWHHDPKMTAATANRMTRDFVAKICAR